MSINQAKEELGTANKHKEAKKGFLQGVVISVGIFSAAFVLAQCTQIDAFRKIADYRAMYEDYRNQALQLKSLADTELVDQFNQLIGVDFSAFRSQVEQAALGSLRNVYGDIDVEESDPESIAINRVGGLHRVADSNSDVLSQCWRQRYGSASIERGAHPVAHIIPRDGYCHDVQEQLNTMSVQQGPHSGTLRPNTALETEVTRSIYYGDYPLLTVLRADLAWIRDHPETWFPMRYPPSTIELGVGEVSRASSDQQRVAAFLSGRGLNFVSDRRLSNDGDTLRWYEDTVSASQALATLGMVYESFAAYPTNYLDLVPVKRALSSVSPNDIDNAQEGDRKAMMRHFEGLQSTVELVSNESNMRSERLLGLWVAQRQNSPDPR